MKYSSLVISALLVSLLSGCSSFNSLAYGPKESTPLINNELAKARVQTKAITQDETKALAREMANALMPSAPTALPRAKKAPTERRFDFSATLLAAPTVYQALVDQSNYNLVIASDVRDPVSINLKDVTLIEALESLRDAYGYEFEIQGRRVVISKPALITKTYQMNYLLGSRSGHSEVRVISGSVADGGQGAGMGGGGSSNSSNNGSQNNNNTSSTNGSRSSSKPQETSRVTTTLQNDFWTTLSTALGAIVGSEGGRQVIINPQSGLVFVKSMPKEMREVETYLKKTQHVVGRQVMLEAKIIEVNLTNSTQTGINWSTFDRNGNHRFSVGANGQQLNPQGGAIDGTLLQGSAGILNNLTSSSSASTSLGMAFTSGSFASLMAFLETQGEVQVLSTPRVATLNNQNAVLKVGTDAFFVTNISTNTTTSGSAVSTSPSITVQPFFSGISFDVTPQIDEDGYVTLHVHPSVSDVFEQSKTINLGSLGTYVLPLASSNINETDSVVKVKDSHIVAIGGLMRISDSNKKAKVPGVGDVPVAGELFKQTSASRTKSELVILIKPTIINAQSDWNSGLGSMTDVSKMGGLMQ